MANGLVKAGDLRAPDKPLQDGDAFMRMVAPSYIHMTNNRLGLNAIDEAFLAYSVARALNGGMQPPFIYNSATTRH